MKSLADDLTLTHNHSTHKGIRTDSAAPALRKLKSSSQMLAIRSCKRRSHID
jgi:hypothetical protein